MAEVVEELVRDVCAGACLLPAPLFPCEDHEPCDEDDECGGCGGCFQDGILDCDECRHCRRVDVARVQNAIRTLSWREARAWGPVQMLA